MSQDSLEPTRASSEVIDLLEEWFDEPDNLGQAWWDEYEQQLSEGLKL